VAEPVVEATEQRAAAGEHDAAVHDVAGQLGRGLVEGDPDGVDDRVHRLLDRGADVGAPQRHGARQPGDQVATTDLRLAVLGAGERRAEGHLDLLGRRLAQQQRVLLLHPVRDGPVHLVARGPDAQAGDDAAEADHGDLRRTAPHVDDHVAGGLVHGQPGADRGGHRLLDDVDPARAGLVAGLLDRPLLDGGDPARHAHDHPRLGEVAAAVHQRDEVAQHLLGGLEVGDHAVLERPDRGDVLGGAADHLLGFVPDGDQLAGLLVDRDHARLVDQDAPAAHVDERVGGAQVHGHVPADEIGRHPSVLCAGKSAGKRDQRTTGLGPSRLRKNGEIPGKARRGWCD
jgi:hypothetical protein